jgi:hypothetical protein
MSAGVLDLVVVQTELRQVGMNCPIVPDQLVLDDGVEGDHRSGCPLHRSLGVEVDVGILPIDQ